MAHAQVAPYMIEPHSEQEARYGKPLLLTDCELAMLLDALPKVVPSSDGQEDALKNLWVKLLTVWETTAPYEYSVNDR